MLSNNSLVCRYEITLMCNYLTGDVANKIPSKFNSIDKIKIKSGGFTSSTLAFVDLLEKIDVILKSLDETVKPFMILNPEWGDVEVLFREFLPDTHKVYSVQQLNVLGINPAFEKNEVLGIIAIDLADVKCDEHGNPVEIIDPNQLAIHASLGLVNGAKPYTIQ